MAVIGVDLGGTKVAVALFDNVGEMIAKDYRLLEGRTGKDVASLLVETLQDIINNNSSIIIDSIGICVPGIVYSKKGTVWAPNIPGWEEFPLHQYILENIKLQNDILICIESDRTCYILGEIWRGVAKGCENAIYLAVGTGIGAGIVLDGHVIHGANDIVGATGWMALHNPYEQEYIPVGCFEYYASGNGIATQARRQLRCDINYDGPMSKKPIEEVTSHDVFAAYDSRDRIAVRVLEHAIEMWGMGAANLVSLFDPEMIVFGGGVFGPGSIFLKRIYDEACKWGQPISMKNVKFCQSILGGDAALMGAAYLALKSIDVA